MSIEYRKSLRHIVRLHVELTYPSGDHHNAYTRDISDGGMFVLMERELQPVLGEVVSLRILPGGDQHTGLPSTEAVVVHVAPHGIGMAYIFLELDENF
jgi:c-di-GMP-binding flagellar brake protein YcgR